MSGDVLGCPSWGTVPPTSSGWRLECYLACHGAQDRPTALNVLSTKVENCSSLSRSVFSFNTEELRPQPPATYRWSYASLNLKTHSEMQATSPHHVSGVALSSGDSLLGSRTFSTWQMGSISAFPLRFLGDSEIRSMGSQIHCSLSGRLSLTPRPEQVSSESSVSFPPFYITQFEVSCLLVCMFFFSPDWTVLLLLKNQDHVCLKSLLQPHCPAQGLIHVQMSRNNVEQVFWKT